MVRLLPIAAETVFVVQGGDTSRRAVMRPGGRGSLHVAGGEDAFRPRFSTFPARP